MFQGGNIGVQSKSPILFEDPLASLHGTDWHFEYTEVHDLRLCDESVLEEAYATAPSSEAKAYIFAIHQFRQALCAVSGRSMRLADRVDVALVGTETSSFVATTNEEGVMLIKQVAAELGGKFSEWQAKGTWQHSMLDIGGVRIEVDVSTHGIVHINQNMFSPLARQTNVTKDAILASVKAILEARNQSIFEKNIVEH